MKRAEHKTARSGYSRDAERELMRSIYETCGPLIAEATSGDPARSALLAAITANESGGCRTTYRFAPAHYQRLLGLLGGAERDMKSSAARPFLTGCACPCRPFSITSRPGTDSMAFQPSAVTRRSPP